jgi:urease accessory protein
MSAEQRIARTLAACFALAATPAAAHSGTGLPGGFVAGFAHPFTGLDHLLAMVSVGVWGVFLGRPLLYALPVIFPFVMVIGALLGMFAVRMPSVEIGIATSVLVLGACIAFAWRAPVWIAASIAAVFALFHGHAHGRELPSAANAIGYSAGFVFATGVLHVLGIGIGEINRRIGADWLTRIVGGAIACCGVWFLAEPVLAMNGSRAATWCALACVLACLPGVSLARGQSAIALKVVSSWLIAIALLMLALQFIPVTPGYAPDHLE